MSQIDLSFHRRLKILQVLDRDCQYLALRDIKWIYKTIDLRRNLIKDRKSQKTEKKKCKKKKIFKGIL